VDGERLEMQAIMIVGHGAMLPGDAGAGEGGD
jgi:hypothetical protein